MSYKGMLDNGDRQYAKYLRSTNFEDVETLTVRELEVLILFSHGMMALEVGLYLAIKVEAVNALRDKIVKKTNTLNIREACCEAIRKGWIS